MKLSLLLLVATATFASAATVKYEWAGMFKTPENKYVWTAQVVKKAATFAYADPTMAIVLMPATAATEAALDALKANAATVINGTCTTVTVGQTLTPSATQCYSIKFSTDLHTTAFPINAAGVAQVAIFAQHFPTEFERDRHYLQDLHGDDIEPVAELPKKAAAAHTDKPWGAAIGASICVTLVTFIGVLFTIPCFASWLEESPETVFSLANAFAAGALLAAAFYLMLYEATHLIVYAKEAQATAAWGSMIILGYLVAQILEIVIGTFYTPEMQDSVEEKKTEAKKPEEETPAPAETPAASEEAASSAPASGSGSGSAAETTKEEQPGVVALQMEDTNTALEAKKAEAADFDPDQNLRVLSGVLLGDFFHNLVDGIVIGAAFLGCSNAVAWGITGATIAHEAAQEIADYLVLTDPKLGALTPAKALLFNFLSGLSVILGALIIVGQDKIENLSQGMLLAFGGGVYVYIAASECMPRVHKNAKTTGLKVASLLVFCLGVFCIGIILTIHEHCVPGAPAGGGHAH